MKLWATNMEHSVATLEAKANVCCVKFNPATKYHIAFGSAGRRGCICCPFFFFFYHWCTKCAFKPTVIFIRIALAYIDVTELEISLFVDERYWHYENAVVWRNQLMTVFLWNTSTFFLDHCVHYYDLRNPKKSLAVLKGHRKAVSYAKFLDSNQIVSA